MFRKNHVKKLLIRITMHIDVFNEKEHPTIKERKRINRLIKKFNHEVAMFKRWKDSEEGEDY